MRLACPVCHAEYDIDERRVPRGGVNVRCPKCKGVFPVRPPRAAPPPSDEDVAVGRPSPEPPASTAGRVPLPPPASATWAEPSATAPAAPTPPGPDHDSNVGSTRAAANAEATATAGPEPFPAPPPDESPPAPEPARTQPPLGFGEVDFGDAQEVLGNEEPFPFETDPAPAPGTAASAAVPSARPVALPEPATSEAAREPEADPFAAAAPVAEDDAPFSAPDPSAVHQVEADASHTDVATVLPGSEASGVAPDSVGEQVADDSATLEALFAPAAVGTAPESPPAEDAAPTHESVPHGFKVRRRSGKVFGPFSEVEIVEMIDKGELLGNEEVSDESAPYAPIASVQSFADAIRRHTEALHLAAGREQPSPKQVTASIAAPQRVVRTRVAPASEKAGSRRWRWAAIGAAVVLAVAGAGVGGALTRYGPFFHRLVRGHTGVHRPGAKLIADARLRLAEDRFDGTKAAVELADGALRLYPSDDDAKAMYTYAVSVLARRYGGAAPAWVRARGFLPEVAKRAGEDADAAKAVVAASLLSGERAPDVAYGTLDRLVAKGTQDGDALLVLGDAAMARGDTAQAATLYAKLDGLAPGSARSSHALGVLAARRGDGAAAQRLFEAALSRDATHLDSAVELARLALAAGDRARAESLARRILAPESQARCGPRQRAQARSVLGLVLARALSDDLEASLAAAERELEAATRDDPDDVDARLALARFQLDRGAAEKASATLAPIAGAGARDRRVTAALALVTSAQGKDADAVRLLDAALEKSPGDARLLYAKGVLASAAGKQGDADRLWVDAAARDATAWEPHLAIARARFLRGDLEGAEKELKLASERASADSHVVSLAADLALARGDAAGAEAGYRRALSIDAAQGEPYLGLARIALGRGDPAGARAALQRAVALEPRLAEAQALRGELLWKARDLPAARKALQAAVALDPHDAMSRARLGAIELESGERDAALADLQAATNLDLGSAEIRAWYGRALLAKGETQGAIEQLRKSIELDAKPALVHLLLGQALERVGNYAEAVDAYRAAQSRAPQTVDGYEALGMLYATQNRCKEALPQLDKAVALAPHEARLRLAVADCKVRLGRYQDAITTYRRILDANPKQVALYYKIARAQHEATGIRDALPWYERATHEEPGNAMPYYYLGFAYKDRNQASKAIAAFREYLRVKPDAEDRKDIEREIEDLGGGTPPAAAR